MTMRKDIIEQNQNEFSVVPEGKKANGKKADLGGIPNQSNLATGTVPNPTGSPEMSVWGGDDDPLGSDPDRK